MKKVHRSIIALLVSALFVSIAYAKGKPGTCRVPGTHAGIQDAVDDTTCEEIRVARGDWAGALINRPVIITGVGKPTITGGPLHPAGLVQGFRLLAGADGSQISHLTFAATVDLAIITGDPVAGVVVKHNTFINQLQAISAWRANNWHIVHNTITDLRTRCGGGIGILLGAYDGESYSGSEVSHNDISGTLHVSPTDCGGYNGSGIVLYSDYRGGRIGGEVHSNYITHNKVSLTSDTPAVVDVVALELTDTRDNPAALPYPVIFDNAIGFNDFRGTAIQIVLTPTDLENHNSISRNLGENRGHGLHPSGFLP